MLDNIFKTQDIIDKYRVIYDSLKKPQKLIHLKQRNCKKLMKSRSVKRSRPVLSKLSQRLNQSERKSKENLREDRSLFTDIHSGYELDNLNSERIRLNSGQKSQLKKPYLGFQKLSKRAEESTQETAINSGSLDNLLNSNEGSQSKYKSSEKSTTIGAQTHRPRGVKDLPTARAKSKSKRVLQPGYKVIWKGQFQKKRKKKKGQKVQNQSFRLNRNKNLVEIREAI